MLHFDVVSWACSSGSRSLLQLNFTKAEGKASIPTSISFLTKLVHSRTHSCFFKSLFSAEKWTLWGTSSQRCKLRRNSFGNQRKAAFYVPNKFRNVTHDKNVQVSPSPAWFTAVLRSNICVFCPLFPQGH